MSGRLPRGENAGVVESARCALRRGDVATRARAREPTYQQGRGGEGVATVKKIERPRCEMKLFDGTIECRRQGNYLVVWTSKAGKGYEASLCYRHRWRAYDMAADNERGMQAIEVEIQR
jgi:hypothetical protein